MPLCPKCGKEVEQGATFCSNCGAALTPQPTPQPTRPKDVTIIAVLFCLNGIIYLVSLWLPMALISFVIAYNSLQKRFAIKWWWFALLVVSSCNIFISLMAITLWVAWTGIIGLVINGIAIYYLTRPHVKAFFGKGAPPSPPPPPPPT